MTKAETSSKFDTEVKPLDWRYSAAIVGLYKYLNFVGDKGYDFEIAHDALRFNRELITEEDYLEFVEDFYKEELPHLKLEHIISRKDSSADQEETANKLLKANSIMKKVFGKMKFDGRNGQEIQKVLDDNRMAIIKETFRNKSNMYANFANTGQLLKDTQACCRLWGYYIDGGRKSKSISYNFNVNNFVYEDSVLFDFIPFAFVGDREVLFINNNASVEQLIDSNITFENLVQQEISLEDSKTKNARKVLFKSIQKSADFLKRDVEVIVKNRENAFYETMYIRKDSIEVIKAIKVYKPFCFSLKLNENYYINVQKEVMDCILNLARTDWLIELFLKKKSERSNAVDKEQQAFHEYLISLFISINQLICKGGEEMNKSMRSAYACAKEVVKVLVKNNQENKLVSYRQKLTSAVIFKDYNRYCNILLQLSNYTGVVFDFAYNLFEDFEENKDVAYTFINALTTATANKDQNPDNKNNESM